MFSRLIVSIIARLEFGRKIVVAFLDEGLPRRGLYRVARDCPYSI